MELSSCACDHKEPTVRANNESPLLRHVKWDYLPVPVTTVTARISNESLLPHHFKWDYIPVPVTQGTQSVCQY